MSLEKMNFKAEFDTDKAVALSLAIRMLTKPVVTFIPGKDIANESALSSALFIEAKEDLEEQFAVLENALKGATPELVAVEGLGVYAIGNTKAEADNKKATLTNGKTVDAPAPSGRVAEKIIIVTGSAQGFGLGIAEELMKDGANVVIADLNVELAKKNADELSAKYGAGKAFAVSVNVSDADSVKAMIDQTVLTFGGLDAFISNAGIVRAGSLDEMTLENFDLVTKVNYNAYFICAKYASKVMKIQNRFNPEYFMDIIQINSKSGLTGSNKNFAYAGSKFGGIGLTQSFALELVPFNIKVNSVCPGNFLDGPLWCDPEKGLFKQYLDAGKVPGAKTVADVKKFYEAKVPMNRGCRPEDVMKAIYYCMEQMYETGQAIPVTGGQNMLK